MRESNPQGREARLFSRQVPSPDRIDSPFFLWAAPKEKAGLTGLEPVAFQIAAGCSVRLSYNPSLLLDRVESNHRRVGLQPTALPPSYGPVCLVARGTSGRIRTCIRRVWKPLLGPLSFGRVTVSPKGPSLVAAPGFEPGSLAYETSVLAPGPSRVVVLRR